MITINKERGKSRLCQDKFWNNNDNEWLYFYRENGHIVKIGMTKLLLREGLVLVHVEPVLWDWVNVLQKF